MANWSLSKKLIIGSFLLSIISLFFKWVDVGLFSVNGFQQQGYLFLLIFIYPLIRVNQGKHINKVGGYVLALLGIIGVILFIMSKTETIFGVTVNAASTGMYFMLISFVGLAAGVYFNAKGR
ncbi:hypothetical protein [Ureibacillus acetophenoni]|uniref:Uncharacterized protein n=1 Tax=Ureibacillus acetophenoni TaxID=614649 RepID=A0A285U4B4_9BACL|nr:hypothetical protein [Ureibacillus acetophenoni]SOC36527.1 hypothetical protein SAMN05877842_102449 [Ureibacillus acetophenoni]